MLIQRAVHYVAMKGRQRVHEWIHTLRAPPEIDNYNDMICVIVACIYTFMPIITKRREHILHTLTVTRISFPTGTLYSSNTLQITTIKIYIENHTAIGIELLHTFCMLVQVHSNTTSMNYLRGELIQVDITCRGDGTSGKLMFKFNGTSILSDELKGY